ncbi:polysaccharide export protein Wza [Halovibrio variabilis]|uniref:Polysaccharide export protein Wza n=1 Tax=Halovibrio variabilis TaxID=31910 RepID=A0A511USJ6_9GAMM|nr:polysaccharide export protein [Halovibrio variabilis]GEN29576.1 polysaccharide export protein Wza [Halovibrio variabilis]
MRKQTIFRLLVVASLALLIAGCSIAPGGDIDYDAPEPPDVMPLVDIKPITPELIWSLEVQQDQERGVHPVTDKLRNEITDYEYTLGVGDVLSIVVYDHPELTIPTGGERSAVEAGNIVRSDGTIFYPFVGRVHVEGKTTEEVRVQLTRGLSDFLTEPQIDVFIAAFNSKRFHVTGAVAAPGSVPVTNVPLTILDAINEVGGPTDNAFWHEMFLFRNGTEEELSLYSLLSEGDQRQNRLLRDGDLLHIPSADNQGVAMLGQVRSPGNLRMNRERLSLTDALSRAGGINEQTAEPSGIFVLRRNEPGAEKLATVYQLDVSNAIALVMASNFQLEPKDVVYVTTAPIARWNRVISLLLPSLNLPRDLGNSSNGLNDLL